MSHIQRTDVELHKSSSVSGPMNFLLSMPYAEEMWFSLEILI